MKVELITNVNGLLTYLVKDKYKVSKLDDQPFICDCSTLNKRDIYTNCKHIKATSKLLTS